MFTDLLRVRSDEPYLTTLSRAWPAMTGPHGRPYLRLFGRLHDTAGEPLWPGFRRGRDHRLARAARGGDAELAVELATVVLAVIRGLLMDLDATGDAARTDRAWHAFLAVYRDGLTAGNRRSAASTAAARRRASTSASSSRPCISIAMNQPMLRCTSSMQHVDRLERVVEHARALTLLDRVELGAQRRGAGLAQADERLVGLQPAPADEAEHVGVLGVEVEQLADVAGQVGGVEHRAVHHRLELVGGHRGVQLLLGAEVRVDALLARLRRLRDPVDARAGDAVPRELAQRRGEHALPG